MELRHLRYFVAVAEGENVSRAALKLHVSQPALSRQIRDLEEELGFPLLERTGKSVRLTEAGRRFLSESKEILQRVDRAVSETRAVAFGLSGEIHVGYAPMPTVRFLPQALRTFQARFPEIKVRLHDLSPEEMLAGLREGRLHLAFLARPTRAMLRGVKFKGLIQDEWRLAVNPGHPLAKRRSIPAALLASEKLIAYSRRDYADYHLHLSRIFSTFGCNPNIVEEHEGGVNLVTAVESGTGVAILPGSLEFTTGPRIKLIPMVPKPPPLLVGVAWVPSRLSNPAAQLIEFAKNSAGYPSSKD